MSDEDLCLKLDKLANWYARATEKNLVVPRNSKLYISPLKLTVIQKLVYDLQDELNIKNDVLEKSKGVWETVSMRTYCSYMDDLCYVIALNYPYILDNVKSSIVQDYNERFDSVLSILGISKGE